MDTPTDIDSSWYGYLSLEDAPRVTISNRSVQFTPLKSFDEGTYSFSARVRSLDSEYLCPSSFVNDSIDISPSKYRTYTITVLCMDMRIIICKSCHFGTCDDYKLCKLYIP